MCHTISQSLVLTNIQSKSEFASNLLAIGPSCHYLQQKLAPSWSAGYTSHQKLHSEHIRKVNHCSSSQRIWKSWFASVIMPNVLINYKDQFGCSVVSDSLQPNEYSMAGFFSVRHQLLDLTQTHVHWVSGAIQPSYSLLSPSPTFSLYQHQDLFQWVSSSHPVANVLEFQLQHQSFQWIFRTDFL